MADSVQFG